MDRVGPLEKMTFDQRLVGNENIDYMDIWTKSDTGQKKTKAEFLRWERPYHVPETARGHV